jgi:beta-lactam-binding protein with PASTA domain
VDASGDFTALVSLREGANVIDVQAGAPRRAAAMTALRVTRRALVAVPDLAGRSEHDATKALEDRGLVADVRSSGGLLDELLPGDPAVCRTDPDAGERVRVGTTVAVEVSKRC